MSDVVTAVTIRRQAFSGLFDLSQGHGLEIGPLAAPLVTAELGDVSYLDLDSREALAAQYADEPSVDCDAIPGIDYWLKSDDGIQPLSAAVAVGAPFDWVVASHVVEHVPDLIGWFREVGEILVDGGSVLLVVPDRRFCFDIHRPPTTVGQVLQAHEDGDRVPSVRAVYDHHRSCVVVQAHEAWAGQVPGTDQRMYSLEKVQDAVRSARNGEYVDSHVWTFTPRSFVAALEDLGLLVQLDFTIEVILPTGRDQLEFYVSLTRIPRDTAPDAAAQLRADTVGRALAMLPDESQTAYEQAAAVAHRSTEDALGLALHRQREGEARVEELTAELASTRERLHAVLASERWRAGGLVVTPLSAARRLLLRRHR